MVLNFFTPDIVKPLEVTDVLNRSFFWNDTTDDNTTYVDVVLFTKGARIEAFLYMLLFSISVTCNVLLFKTLIRFRHRNMRFDVMILNKTVADMMVIFLMVPIEVLWKVTVEWVAGDPACRLLLFIKACGHYSASMVLLCMCIDRYMLMVHPMITCDAYQRNKMMLCLAWAFSCICSIPQGIIFHVEQHPLQPSFEQCVRSNFFSAEYQRVAYNVFCMAAMYVAPLSVIIFCFTKIVGEIKKPASD
ncbi:hypothetical protein JTE90_011732, partial [Oedothorax gibbosus]